MRGAKSKKKHVFIGVSFAGGKTDKSCIVILEYFADAKRVFLSRIFDKIKSDEAVSADLKIHEIITHHQADLECVAFDVPWSLPSCLTCRLVCPGYEACKEDHIQWMWKSTKHKNKSKKPKKLFTPYTQRCIEMYLQNELDLPNPLPPMMGANTAPLLARAAFVSRRLEAPIIEVFPQLSIWRIGKALGSLKSHLKNTRKSAMGADSRRGFLSDLNHKNLAFIYEQDTKLMIESNHAFEAFICAFTAFLKFKGLTEDRPSNFPKYETWIEFPLEKLKY